MVHFTLALTPENRFAGLNQNIKDDSWEAQEEKRIKQERLERETQEKLAQIEAEKQRKAEAERLAKIEAARQEKLQRINRKKQEIAFAESKYEQAVRPYYAFLDRHSNSRYEISRHKHQPWYPELMRLWQIQSNAQSELSRLKREFSEIEQ